MRTDRHKQDDLGIVVLGDLEHDSQVVACASHPEAGEIALEFVARKAFVKGVFLQDHQCIAYRRERFAVFLAQSLQ